MDYITIAPEKKGIVWKILKVMYGKSGLELW